MRTYTAQCRQCDKKVKDDDKEVVYVVATDEYFCNDNCMFLHVEKEQE